VPAFLSNASMTMADTSMRLSSKPGVPDDRVLVVVQLSGGNDGLNTVVPYGMDAYYKARPRIGINTKKVLSLDQNHGIGLHPNLHEIYEMVQSGLGTVVQGVGYPNPIRSHFASMDVWHTGVTSGKGQHGWLGKAFDHADDHNGLDLVTIGSHAPLAAEGKKVKPVAFERPELFQWSGRTLSPKLSKAYDELRSVHPMADPNDPTSFIFRTACDAQVASAKVRKAVSQASKTKFPGGNRLAAQLKQVAAMIRAELPTRVYYVAMGGFDTHAGETTRHPRLMSEFSQAMQAFYKELEATGHRKRVVSRACSEFGRRVAENASGGTDHGTAGPMFLFGDPIKPGLLGTHPSLTSLDHGDLKFTVDFRCLYADLLDNWLKLDSKAALGREFRHTKLVRA